MSEQANASTAASAQGQETRERINFATKSAFGIVLMLVSVVFILPFVGGYQVAPGAQTFAIQIIGMGLASLFGGGYLILDAMKESDTWSFTIVKMACVGLSVYGIGMALWTFLVAQGLIR